MNWETQMNWEMIEIDLEIFNTEFDTEQKNTPVTQVVEESLSPVLNDFYSRESAIAASVGDFTGVTARPNKGFRLAERFEAVLELR